MSVVYLGNLLWIFYDWECTTFLCSIQLGTNIKDTVKNENENTGDPN